MYLYAWYRGYCVTFISGSTLIYIGIYSRAPTPAAPTPAAQTPIVEVISCLSPISLLTQVKSKLMNLKQIFISASFDKLDVE